MNSEVARRAHVIWHMGPFYFRGSIFGRRTYRGDSTTSPKPRLVSACDKTISD